MTRPFRSERVFHDTRGWYIALRPCDAGILRDLPVPGRHRGDDLDLVVGPFRTRDDLDAWFASYVDRFGISRSEAQRAA